MNKELDTKKVIDLANQTFGEVNADKKVVLHPLTAWRAAELKATDGFFNVSDMIISAISVEGYTASEHSAAADLSEDLRNDNLAGYAVELSTAIYDELLKRNVPVGNKQIIFASIQEAIKAYDKCITKCYTDLGIAELGPIDAEHDVVLTLYVEVTEQNNDWGIGGAIICHRGPTGQWGTGADPLFKHHVFLFDAFN